MIPEYFNEFRYYESSGGNIRLLDFECPYCGKSGKLYVKPSKFWVFCFYCSKNYNLVEFIAEFEGITKAQAYRLLKTNEDIDKYTIPKKNKPAPVLKQFFPELQNMPLKAIQYLSNRNIPDSFISRFKMLFCPSNSIYNDKLLYTSNRIIFSIYDIDCNLHSWVGRDINGTSKIKYMMSPDCQPSKHLYNACSIEQDSDYLIVTEGVMDVFGWCRCGFNNVVATFGKKISKTQVDLLKRINPKVLLFAWDYNCYYEMANVIEKMKHLFSCIKIVELPASKDADECLKIELINAFKNSKQSNWRKKMLLKIKF